MCFSSLLVSIFLKLFFYSFSDILKSFVLLPIHSLKPSHNRMYSFNYLYTSKNSSLLKAISWSLFPQAHISVKNLVHLFINDTGMLFIFIVPHCITMFIFTLSLSLLDFPCFLIRSNSLLAYLISFSLNSSISI